MKYDKNRFQEARFSSSSYTHSNHIQTHLVIEKLDKTRFLLYRTLRIFLNFLENINDTSGTLHSLVKDTFLSKTVSKCVAFPAKSKI